MYHSITSPFVNMLKTNFLDDAHNLLLQQDTHNGMELLFQGLKQLHTTSIDGHWQNFVNATALKHPIKELIHQCPFTNHAFFKPRGYVGDAELIDFIYGKSAEKQQAMDSLAASICEYTLNTPAARAVRYRRKRLARCIDEVATNETNPSILSLAAGHLREVEFSKAMINGQIGCLYALDQDKENIELIQREYADYKISAVVGSVRQLFSDQITFSNLSLVYTAGLFDYLSDKTAQKLIAKSFGYLKPGGRMLVANFLPNIPDVGYMETFMDWFLIFRSPEEMVALFDVLPEDQLSSLLLTFDPDENIVFIEAVKN